ncbi:MAG: 2-phospho-L-lactate guanylyltransferase [Chloroflexi bacterium]|nr:2-phospho-L-lactate guanylyltransferase [Chloroflexota bacterium]MQC26963.1 2-phospho-L-lactate guanylyltransferase [Chloroflexota bacterium]
MTLWAIVPVKPLRRGKSRLAGVLSEDDRAALNRRLLSHTIDTLKSMSEVVNVLVVSRDPEALALARDHKARTLLEDGAPHLNVALQRATQVAKSYKSQSVLVIPADLPQIQIEDIRAMLEAGSQPPVVVIAPDHRKEGTNALYLNPAGIIDYDFGEGSFLRHRQRALAAGAGLKICELPSLAHDVDLPEDLDFLSAPLEELGNG